MNEPLNVGPLADPYLEEDEISLLDLAIVMAKRKRFLFRATLTGTLLGLVISLLLPVSFTATTRIMPPQQNQSTASAMLAQLGGLGGIAGAAAGIKTPSDLYVGMLKSRTVADDLIQRFDLRKIYHDKLMSVARKDLEGISHFTADKKDGIIEISVDDHDPQRAAAMANAYVDELYKLTQVLAVTDASQRRLFFERQLNQARDSLTHAEAVAQHAVENGGLNSVDAEGRTMIQVTARLRGQIAAKEVEIAAMRSFAAEKNPNLRVAQEELIALKSQLEKMEGRQQGKRDIPSDGGGPLSVAGESNLALMRNLKYYEVVEELLTKQYQAAKIDEAKDAALIQVIDKAIVPDHKSKPKRALITLLAGVASLFLSLLWVFVAEGVQKSGQDAETAQRWETLRRLSRWRS